MYSDEKSRLREMDDAIVAASKVGSEVARNLHVLCDEIGTRFAGSTEDRIAAEAIRDTFERYGLIDAHLEAFPFTAWRRGDATHLRLVAPYARELPCYAMPYGAATGGAGIEASWVDIGSGSAVEVDHAGARLKGALAITDGSSGSRKDIQRRCVAAGASGVLHGHLADGMLFKTGSVDDGVESPIPAVSIPAEVLAFLRRIEGEGRLRLAVDCMCEASTTYNVVGEWRGTGNPDELVIMGGHFDSHDLSPGAYDNAAGVSIVMEVARLLQPYRQNLKRSVRFVAFGAEEMGLLGSRYHARTHAAALRKARLMLNCDTPCLGRPHGLAFHKCAEAEAFVKRLACEMEEDIVFANRKHNSSDHFPFLQQGVITAGLGGKGGKSRGGAFYHTAADTVEKLEIAELADTAAFAARILLRAANMDDWPELRHDPTGS